ncbi:MAG: hypothetical protein AAF682_32850, partial [Planctomycetota bacterium]
MGGPIQGFPFLGYELLILAPYIETQAFGVHNIPLPPDSSAVGFQAYVQGARVELVGGLPVGVLLNGLDLVLGH